MKLGSGQQPRSHRVPFWRRIRIRIKTRVRRNLVAVTRAKSLNWAGV